MITLRFFHQKDDKLYLDPGRLAMAVRAKAVRCVIHGKVTGDWVRAHDALYKAATYLYAGLEASMFKSVALFFVMLLAAAATWWTPIRPLGHDFGFLAVLPLVTAGLCLTQAISALVMGARIKKALSRLFNLTFHAGPDAPLPLSQLAPRKAPPTRRWPALLCGLLAIIFIFGVFPYAIPLPGYAAVTSTDRASDTVPLRLALGERWELTPRYVNDYSWGMIYYDGDTEQVLVLEVHYSVNNRQHWSPSKIREQFSAWTNWLSHNLSTNALAQLPPELDEADVLDWLYAQFQVEIDAYAGEMTSLLRSICSERLECTSSVQVGVKVIPVAKYRDYLRRK